MPIQEGKYVTPAWQNSRPPAIDAAELTAIGNSIVTNQNNILTNTQNIQTNQQDIEALQSTVQNINENYLNKTGDTMSGQLGMGNNKIVNLGTPSSSTDAATKGYVDGLNLLGWELIYSQAVNINATSSSQTLDINTPTAITSIGTRYAYIMVIIRGSYSLTVYDVAASVTFKFNDIDLIDRSRIDEGPNTLYAVCSYPNLRCAYSADYGWHSEFVGYNPTPNSTETLPFGSSRGQPYDQFYAVYASESYSQTFNGTIYYYGLST